MRRLPIPWLTAALVMAVVGAAMWRSPVPWTLTNDTGNGFLGQTLPAYRAWMSGRIPEWSDLLWGGFPLIGDCSNAVLYPPHLLAYLATIDVPLRFFDVALVLHAGLLAAGAGVLARDLGCGRAAQAFAGVVSVLTPAPHFSALVYFPAFAAQAWWPWAFVAAERLCRPTARVRDWALGWIALAAQIHAGMPEQATYCAMAMTAWMLVRGRGLGIVQRGARLVLLGLGAAFACAPQLLPTIAYLPHTLRDEGTGGAGAGAIALMLDRPVQLFVAGTGVLHSLPSFFGLAVPALVLIAIVRRRPGAGTLTGIALAAFVFAVGTQLPVWGWLHEVPPFSHFRTPIKLQVLVELTLVWAAALGLDALLSATARPAHAIAAVLAAVTVAERGVYLVDEAAVFDVMRANTAPSPAILDALAQSVPIRTRQPNAPPSLVFDVGGPTGGGVARSFGALVELASLRPFQVALVGKRHPSILRASVNRPDRLTALGVEYALVDDARCAAFERALRWPVAEKTPQFCLLKNPVPGGRYTLLSRAIAVGDDDAMVQRLYDDPAGPTPVVTAADAVVTSSGQTVVESYAPGRAAVTTTAPDRALLLARESFLPGWRARVDGADVATHPAAGIYFAVPVPAGTHEVTLEYRTPGFRTGVALATAWWIGALGWTLVRRRRAAHALSDAVTSRSSL